MRLGLFVIAGLLCPLALAKAEGIATPVFGSGGGVSGSGILDTLSNGNGSFTITSITGDGVTGLLPPAPNGYGPNDNLLFPNSPTAIVDTNGFSFTDVMGDTGYEVNLFSDGNGGYLINLTDSDGDVSPTITAGFSLTDPGTPLPAGVERKFGFLIGSAAEATAVTPEPSSIALLGTGLLGVAGLLKRRAD